MNLKKTFCRNSPSREPAASQEVEQSDVYPMTIISTEDPENDFPNLEDFEKNLKQEVEEILKKIKDKELREIKNELSNLVGIRTSPGLRKLNERVEKNKKTHKVDKVDDKVDKVHKGWIKKEIKEIKEKVERPKESTMVEYIDDLFARDFPEFSTLTESCDSLIKFIPECFITGAHNFFLPEKEDQRKQLFHEFAHCAHECQDKELKANCIKENTNIYEASIGYRGDKTEMDCYHALREFFKDRQDIALVIHGHEFFDDPKMTKKYEKDFVIINLTYQYVMVVEAKNCYGLSSAQKAREQLENARDLIQFWLGKLLDKSWLFIPVIYCNKVQADMLPLPSNDDVYLIIGKSICNKSSQPTPKQGLLQNGQEGSSNFF